MALDVLGRDCASDEFLSSAHTDPREPALPGTDPQARASTRSARDTQWANGGIRRIVWVGLGLATLQQLVGINVVFYYGAVLWQSVGFTEGDALAIKLLSGGLSIAAVTITILLIDRIGRKPTRGLRIA